MLGAAFVTLLGALCGQLSWWLVLLIVLLWIGKMSVQEWLSGECATQGETSTAPGIGKELMQFRIQAGREVYCSQPLDAGMPYRVVVRGTNGTWHHHTSRGLCSVDMDAVYLTGGEQYPRHEGLLFDGEPAVVCDEDRHKHCYTFAYTGTGRHMSILLRVPQDHTSLSYSDGPLKVTIRTLTAAEEVEVKAMEDKQHREVAQMQQEELSRQALALATLAHVDSNFLKADYRQNYAAKHTNKILTQERHEWLTEYQQLLNNEPLFALVQEQHPHVIPFLEARLEVVRIAQRLAVEPTSAPPLPPAKPKVTPEEWQARIERYRQRSLIRKRVKVEDYKADVMQDLELLQEFSADLDSYPLDEDERERLITEFKERLLGGEEESSNGFKQL